MLRGLTTGESQPVVVKCGVYANADEELEEDEGEVVVVVVVGEEEVEGEEGDADEDEDENNGAEVPFMAKRAVRVSSAWGMKVLLPVRSARR